MPREGHPLGENVAGRIDYAPIFGENAFVILMIPRHPRRRELLFNDREFGCGVHQKSSPPVLGGVAAASADGVVR